MRVEQLELGGSYATTESIITQVTLQDGGPICTILKIVSGINDIKSSLSNLYLQLNISYNLVIILQMLSEISKVVQCNATERMTKASRS